MPTTRSRARGIPENTPPQNLPAPVPTSSKWKSAKLPKNSEAARSNGADLLQTLLEEQEKELDEALGQKECSSHTRSRGRGRGRGHGCRGGRGSRGGSQAMTPEIADAETLEVDNLDTMDSDVIQMNSDGMQVDSLDSQTKARSVDCNGAEGEPNSSKDHTEVDIEVGHESEGSKIDEEYETWEGFGRDDNAHNPKTATEKYPVSKAITKCRAQTVHAGKGAVKRKAPRTVEKSRKRVISGIKMAVDSLSDPSDEDEIISHLGGFAGDENHRTVTADREAIVGSIKSNRRSATSAVSIAHNAPSKPKVVEARKIGNLPQLYREKFDADFVPLVIRFVARLDEPWNNPDGGAPLQKIHNNVYKNVDGIVDRQHPLVEPAKAKVTAWRVAIKKKAQRLVDKFFSEEDNISPAPSIHQYVAWLKPDDEGESMQDVPFMFSNGLRYKAKELEGKYLNPLILKTFTTHFSSSGVNDDPMNHLTPPPIGAFALTITAVERALESWRNGKVDKVSEFSQGNWGASTLEYVRGLKKISETRWRKILGKTQEFTPYKPREATASPDGGENYHTKAPDSDVEI